MAASEEGHNSMHHRFAAGMTTVPMRSFGTSIVCSYSVE